MSLTAGAGPFSKRPTGQFNFEPSPPGSAIYWHEVPQRVRAVVGGETVVDSRRAKLLHETGHLPVYYFPLEDVRLDLLTPTDTRTHCPFKGEASYRSFGDVEDLVWEYEAPLESVSFIKGHVALYWKKVDAWFVEEEQVFGHARDPFHRIDVYPASQHVRVLLDGAVVADSTRALVLFETGLPPRYYLPTEDVRELGPSDTVTRCAYKGEAMHFSAPGHEDVAWTYLNPDRDAEPVRGLIAFYNERVDLELDGEIAERPVTQWSR